MDKQGLEKTDVDIKIPNIRGMVKKTDYNTKIAEIEIKIPSVTGLVTAAALNKKNQAEIETKILDIDNLATKAALNKKPQEFKIKYRKTDNDTKITEIQNKIQDVCSFDTKLRGINTIATSIKIRHVHTETKLNEHITSNKKTNRLSDKRSWTIINKGANEGINK